MNCPRCNLSRHTCGACKKKYDWSDGWAPKESGFPCYLCLVNKCTPLKQSAYCLIKSGYVRPTVRKFVFDVMIVYSDCRGNVRWMEPPKKIDVNSGPLFDKVLAILVKHSALPHRVSGILQNWS